MWVEIYQTTRSNNPEDSKLPTYRCDNLKSYKPILIDVFNNYK